MAGDAREGRGDAPAVLRAAGRHRREQAGLNGVAASAAKALKKSRRLTRRSVTDASSRPHRKKSPGHDCGVRPGLRRMASEVCAPSNAVDTPKPRGMRLRNG